MNEKKLKYIKTMNQFLEENKMFEYLDLDNNYSLKPIIDDHKTAEKVMCISKTENNLGIDGYIYGESEINDNDSEYGDPHIHLEINGKETELYLINEYPYIKYKAGEMISKEVFDFLQVWFQQKSRICKGNKLHEIRKNWNNTNAYNKKAKINFNI